MDERPDRVLDDPWWMFGWATVGTAFKVAMRPPVAAVAIGEPIPADGDPASDGDVVALTDRMTRMATLRNRRSRTIRNAMIRMIGRIPAVRRWVATELAGLRNR